MDTIQPEWFYSSLAQAAAAIVGLIGAILGTRILDQIAIVHAEKQRVDERINNVHSLIRRRIEWLPQFREYLEADVREDQATIARGTSRRQIHHESHWGGGTSGGVWSSEVNDKSIAQKLENLRVLDFLTQAYLPLDGVIREANVLEYATRLRKISTQYADVHLRGATSVSSPATMLQDDARNLEALADAIRIFRSSLIPRSFTVVFVALGVLAVTGILWPLSALPGRESLLHSKRGMLAAFGIGLAVLVWYFATQLRELARAGNELYWHS